MKTFYVYMYIRSNNSKHGNAGTPYYIGKGCGNRAYVKQGHHVRVPSDRSRIIFILRDVSEGDAYSEEKRVIALYGRIDNGTGILRNLTDGGEGGGLGHHYGLNETSFKDGHTASEEVRAKLSAAGKERMTPERRAHLSSKLKSIGAGAPLGNKHFAGHSHTAETRQKMSEIATGRKRSPETIARMRIAARERCTPEVRARMSAAQRLRFAKERVN